MDDTPIHDFQKIITVELYNAINAINLCITNDAGRYLENAYENVLQLIMKSIQCKKPDNVC